MTLKEVDHVFICFCPGIKINNGEGPEICILQKNTV